MPATRSKSSAATKQTKLSFSSLKRTGSSQDTKKGKKASVKAHEFTQSQDDTEKEPAEVKPQALPVAVPEELPAPREELRVNDPRWKGVLKDAREKMSYHEPIHGEGENKIHQILRVFDMSYKYGPCAGISRLERWNRANALGLDPPAEIRDILLTRQGIEETDYAESCLYDRL